MSMQDVEKIVDDETAAAGLTRRDWGFRSGVRDGLSGNRGEMCDPEWPGYDEGFLVGQVRAAA